MRKGYDPAIDALKETVEEAGLAEVEIKNYHEITDYLEKYVEAMRRYKDFIRYADEKHISRLDIPSHVDGDVEALYDMLNVRDFTITNLRTIIILDDAGRDKNLNADDGFWA
jgi:hypothetical protein